MDWKVVFRVPVYIWTVWNMKMLYIFGWSALVLTVCGFNQFDDSVLFHLSWPGPELESPPPGSRIAEAIEVSTADNERYRCTLPVPLSETEDSDEEYLGPSAAELMKPIYRQVSCTYRIETYWTYELCHGKYIRQYHEEKETGKKIKLQEYYLGRFQSAEGTQKPPPEEGKQGKTEMVPYRKLDGIDMPFFPEYMSDGTPCDLKSEVPRTALLLYMCHPDSKNEIVSVEEVTTCNYEIIVFTPLLCRHPDYRQKDTPVNGIHCHAIHDAPIKPKILQQVEKESQQMQTQSQRARQRSGAGNVVFKRVDPYQKKQDPTGPVDSGPLKAKLPSRLPTQASSSSSSSEQSSKGFKITSLTDKQLLEEFLRGEYCLKGGTGWWKHEFCYGKHVHQYHEDQKLGNTVISIGTWNKQEHLDWAKENPGQATPRRNREDGKVRMVTHYYGHGDMCDVTGRPREVLVKMKCKVSDQHSVTIYLIEPNTCEYILGVESPIICSLLDTADENGLLSVPTDTVKGP
ncbi:endoplasmic reticulum lectin 1-like isoform X2 [Branchiostoma lanceolatum]|uniref:endoplasmic reticulum lectin 1-like isoform X2 n=1 Tax=Branchiostoma lanceolatum TaxID=7740 RepID=UPI0034555CDA